MISFVSKTISAVLLVLGATSATATTVGQVSGPANINNFAAVQGDLGLAGTIATNGEFISGFSLSFNIPAELQLVQISDGDGVSNAGYSSLTDGLGAVNGVGVLAPTLPTAGSASTVALGGFVANILDINSFGIDILNMVFSTSSAGVFQVGYSGQYTQLLGFTATSQPVTQDVTIAASTFNVTVVDPNPQIIPLPAGSVLLLTGAGALITLRKRHRRA